MADIRPIHALRYAKGKPIQTLIAPPYDVVDQAKKDALASDPHNIVHIDLPHMPPKTAGPVEGYAKSAQTLNRWVDEGVLEKCKRPALYPYTQSFSWHGRTLHRRGFFCLVRLSAFGDGEVVPHEKTYAGAIEDRLMLMRATKTAISPVFGLYSDPSNKVMQKLMGGLGRPDVTAELDGVRHDLWSVTDAAVEMEVMDMLKGKPIYIADGHHRYTTALQYQKEMEEKHGGKLPPAHPANFALFVLVSMQDDGLVVLPTHRLVSGMVGFDVDEFAFAVRDELEVKVVEGAKPDAAFSEHLPMHAVGMYVGATKKCYHLLPQRPDVLERLEPKASPAWRKLDVAVVSRLILEEVIKPRFGVGGANGAANGGGGGAAGGVSLAYTADIAEAAAKVDAGVAQIALILRPTPVTALEELGKTGELMPQKSTFFAPKLATGLIMAPLE